jgi:hypothetical protein
LFSTLATQPASTSVLPVSTGSGYAFCRRVQPDQTNYYDWDSQSWLGRTIFLSRLIRPTTIATALLARLYFEGEELKTVRHEIISLLEWSQTLKHRETLNAQAARFNREFSAIPVAGSQKTMRSTDQSRLWPPFRINNL